MLLVYPIVHGDLERTSAMMRSRRIDEVVAQVRSFLVVLALLLMFAIALQRGPNLARLLKQMFFLSRKESRLRWGSLLFVGGGAVIWVCVLSTERTPTLETTREIYDLRELPLGTAKHSVTITNTNAFPVNIKNVVTSCACASVDYPQVIAPGAKGLLDFTLRVSVGKQSARVGIILSDRDVPAKEFELSWSGVGAPALVPYRIVEDHASAKSDYTREVALTYRGGIGEPVPQVIACECDSPLVSVTMDASNPLARHYDASSVLSQISGEQKLHVRVKSALNAKPFKGECRFSILFGKETYNLVLPIAINYDPIGPRLTATEVVITAGDLPGLIGQERRIGLEGVRRDCEIAFQSLPSWLTGSALDKQEGYKELVFKVTGPPALPYERNNVILSCGKSSKEVIEVPIITYAADALSK
jgi:hypothetical protein